MNIKQAEQRARDLLAAIEAHKRREPVEAANWDEEDWAVMDSPDFNSFGALKYRPAAITFPPCPDAYGWHNPAELDARTVGVHEGWRLLTEKEAWKDGVAADVGSTQWWRDGSWSGTDTWTAGRCTLRTRTPYVAPAPWSLPPPPPGQQWHRTDDWTKEMLPDGWRPLLLGERYESGDEFGNGGKWYVVSGLLGMAVDNVAWSRTRRPLPALQYWSSPEHVPPGMVWLRWKGTTEAALLTYIDQHGFRPGWGDLRAWDVLRNAEWSSDRSPGSWKPCTVAP